MFALLEWGESPPSILTTFNFSGFVLPHEKCKNLMLWIIWCSIVYLSLSVLVNSTEGYISGHQSLWTQQGSTPLWLPFLMNSTEVYTSLATSPCELNRGLHLYCNLSLWTQQRAISLATSPCELNRGLYLWLPVLKNTTEGYTSLATSPCELNRGLHLSGYQFLFSNTSYNSYEWWICIVLIQNVNQI